MPKVSQRFSEAKKGSAAIEPASGQRSRPTATAAIVADGLHPKPRLPSAMTRIATPSSMIGGLKGDEFGEALVARTRVFGRFSMNLVRVKGGLSRNPVRLQRICAKASEQKIGARQIRSK